MFRLLHVDDLPTRQHWPTRRDALLVRSSTLRYTAVEPSPQAGARCAVAMKHRGDRHQQNQSHQPPSATEYLAEGVPPDDAEPIDARSSAPRTVAVTAYADGEHEPPALTPVPAPPWVSSALPNDMLALVCCYLGPCELGRLACVARRFTEGDDGGAQQLSPIEEGARLRLQLMVTRGGGSATQNGEATWLLALRSVECPVVFASCGPEVVLSDDGTRSASGILPSPSCRLKSSLRVRPCSG